MIKVKQCNIFVPFHRQWQDVDCQMQTKGIITIDDQPDFLEANLTKIGANQRRPSRYIPDPDPDPDLDLVLLPTPLEEQPSPNRALSLECVCPTTDSQSCLQDCKQMQAIQRQFIFLSLCP